MSAIPQLPERILDGSGPRNKEASAIHIEHAYSDDTPKPEVANISGRRDEKFQMHDTVVENFRPIKVIVIGAGYSGIYHGIRIPERIKNCELVIYEKNAGVGGTW